jgi:exonuclease III
MKYLNIFILCLLLSSCSKHIKSHGSPDNISIGTYNMEWLGDGYNDKLERNEDDYKQLAEIIKNTDVDLLGVQEIENEKAIKRILKYLPDYDFYIGSHGHTQNVGILYKNDIDIKEIHEYIPLEVEKGRTRPGLVFQAKKGNFEWEMMVVHFKSTSQYDDTEQKIDDSRELRLKQSTRLSYWIDSVLQVGKESDIVIVGDFNDTPLRKEFNSLEPLSNDSNIKFLTDSLKSCKYRNWYVIDQIIVSQSAFNRVINNSLRIYDTYSTLPKNKLEKISDHCPIIVDFEVKSPDRDSGR